MRVLGVDGCKQGWVAVTLEDGRFERADVVNAFKELVDTKVEVIAVDIPVGLVKRGWPETESSVLEFLEERRSSLFPRPPGPVVNAEEFEDACQLATTLIGQRMSSPVDLLPKMRELDAYIDNPRLFEVHPQTSFAVMNDNTRPGNDASSRRVLLARHGLVLPEQDDLLDAAAAAWTALRIARKQARSFPPKPTQKDRGHLIAIWA